MYWWVGLVYMVKLDTVIKVLVKVSCTRSVTNWEIHFRHPNLLNRHISSNAKMSFRKEKFFTLLWAS